MIQVHDQVIVDCCNAMLDGYSLESVLDRWDARIVDDLSSTLDREDTRKRIKERIKKYDKYDSVEDKV
jgi:hypothetical protein